MSVKPVGLKAQVIITEDITPEIQQTLTSLGPAIRTSLYAYGTAIRQNVKQAFRAAQAKGPMNSPVTMAIKGGTTALKEIGALESAVMEDSGRITIKHVGNTYIADISWDFPVAGFGGLAGDKRKNKGFVYLLSHEYGNVKPIQQIAKPIGDTGFFTLKKRMWFMKPRPFLQVGIQTGMVTGTQPSVQIMANVLKIRKAPPIVITSAGQYKPFGVPLLPSLYPTTASGMGWYFVPPSQMYAVIGATSDLMGAWRGSFNEKSIVGYLRQYAWGGTGVTKKSARRKFRRRLWGRV